MVRARPPAAWTNGSKTSGRSSGGGDAHAVVAHAKLGLPVHEPETDRHRPTLTRELGRVLEQVPDDLRDARGVRIDPHRAALLEAQLDLPPLEEAPVVVAGPRHDLAKVELLQLELDLPPRDARHIEQVVHEPREVLGLAADHVLRSPRLLTVARGAVEQVDAVADRRERVAQLVREHAEELGLEPVRLSDRLVGALVLGDVHDVAVP